MYEQFKALIKKNKRLERFCRQALSLNPLTNQFNRTFWEYYQLLCTAETWDEPAVKELQFRRLRELLDYAYRRSAFYQQLYDEYGVSLGQIQSFADFQKNIPIINKAMVKEAGNITIPVKGMRLNATSGTTGSPFRFYRDPAGKDRELAAIYYQWARIGFRPGDYRVELRGYQEEAIAEYPEHAVVRFSIIKMEKNIHKMVAYLNRSQIKFMHGYPSAIHKFVALLEKYRLTLAYQLVGVMLASENVYDWQVNAIKAGLNPRALIAHYGNTEQVALGAWCENSAAYHFLPLYGYVESGNNQALIGTGFLNRATPLIRYQMTDTLIDYTETFCPQCRRMLFPLTRQIGGRLEEYLVTENEELIPPAVVTFPFKHLERIEGVQIIQFEDKNILLRYRCQNIEGSQPEIAALIRALHSLVGGSIPITAQQVQDIPLSDNCKYQWIISKCKK